MTTTDHDTDLDRLTVIVEEVEQAYPNRDRRDAAIIAGAQANNELRRLRDAADSQDVRERASALKARLRVAMRVY